MISKNCSKLTREEVKNVNRKLDIVLPQRVNINSNSNEHPQIYILYDKSAESDDFNLYVMRCQKKYYKRQKNKLMQEWGGHDIVLIFKIKQPNAVIF